MYQIIYLIFAMMIAVLPLLVVGFLLRGLTMIFMSDNDHDEDDDNNEDHHHDHHKDEKESIELPSSFNI